MNPEIGNARMSFKWTAIPITVATTLLAERYDERGSTEALEEAIKIMEQHVEADNQGHAPTVGAS